MSVSYLLEKLSPLGFAVFGAIAVTGITIDPAQASLLTVGSDLAWTGITDDFITEVANPAVVGNVFDVIMNFDPIDNEGPTLITGVSGDFVNWFSVGDVIDLPEDSMTFEFETNPLPGTPPSIAVYTVTEAGEFNFTNALLPDATLADGVTPIDQLKFVIPEGTQFLLTTQTNNNVNFDLCTETCEGVPFWMINGKVDPAISNFQFKDDPATGGTYGASSITIAKAPEPAFILGLFVIGSLGLGLKRKKELLRVSQ